MKAAEFIKSLATMAGVKDEDKLTAAMEALKDTEVDDELAKGISGSLLTMERAKNDPELKKHYNAMAMGSIYGNVNDMVDTVVLSAIPGLKEKLAGAENDSQRIKTTLRELTEMATKQPDGAPDVSKYTKEISSLHEQLATKDKELEELGKKSKQGISSLKKTFALQRKIYDQPLVDKIPGGKEFLANAVSSKILDSYTVTDDLQLRQKDDPEAKVYNGNDEVTIDHVLSNELKDFIKKSEPKPPGGGGPTPPDPKPDNQKTLADLRREAGIKTSI